jgi:hypothetical protein
LAKIKYIKLKTIKSAAFHFLYAVIPINKAKLTGALLQLQKFVKTLYLRGCLKISKSTDM